MPPSQRGKARLFIELTADVLADLRCELKDFDVPVPSIHADPLPIPDQPGCMLHPTTAGKPYTAS